MMQSLCRGAARLLRWGQLKNKPVSLPVRIAEKHNTALAVLPRCSLRSVRSLCYFIHHDRRLIALSIGLFGFLFLIGFWVKWKERTVVLFVIDVLRCRKHRLSQAFLQANKGHVEFILQEIAPREICIYYFTLISHKI